MQYQHSVATFSAYFSTVGLQAKHTSIRAYSNATLCQNFKAIGEELSGI